MTYNGIYTPKLPKLYLTTDAKLWPNMLLIQYMSICGCKRATVQFITWLCYTYITTFLFFTARAMLALQALY